jgi:hypothetical protein
MRLGKVDPAYYYKRPKFGVAGGADELCLTEAGRIRAFKVANGIQLSMAEYEVLGCIAASGVEGYSIHSQATSELNARRLITGNHAHKWVATDLGNSMLERASDEEQRLLERIKEEQ